MMIDCSDMPDMLVISSDVLLDETLSLRQIRVLLAIFSWRKKNTNVSNVSREMLAKRTGYPLSRISTITTELVAKNWLEKTGNLGKGRWAKYAILDPNNSYQNGNGYQNGKVTESDTVKVTESVTVKVTESGTSIDTGKEQIKEQVKRGDVKSPLKNPKKFPSLNFDNLDISKQLAIELADYRKRIKNSPLTQRALVSVCKQINEVSLAFDISHDDVLTIQQERGWMVCKVEWVANHLGKVQSKNKRSAIESANQNTGKHWLKKATNPLLSSGESTVAISQGGSFS